MEMVNRLCIYGMILVENAKDRICEFYNSEDGVANVVATIIVLLITVLLIVAFWGQLKTWVQSIMDNIFGTSFTSEGLKSE